MVVLMLLSIMRSIHGHLLSAYKQNQRNRASTYTKLNNGWLNNHEAHKMNEKRHAQSYFKWLCLPANDAQKTAIMLFGIRPKQLFKINLRFITSITTMMVKNMSFMACSTRNQSDALRTSLFGPLLNF